MSSSTNPPQTRFGILGCADIARKLIRAITLAPNATVTAIASRSETKVASFAASNSLPPTTKLYSSYDALLDDPDIDAVYIPLPTSLHLRWAVATAKKKKHVLLEKPVALNVGEFDEILRICNEFGVQFMDGTMWVHHPRTQVMGQFFSDSQLFGQLMSDSGVNTNFLTAENCCCYGLNYPLFASERIDAINGGGFVCIKCEVLGVNSCLMFLCWCIQLRAPTKG